MEYWNDGIMGKERTWKNGMLEEWNNGKNRIQIGLPHIPVLQYSIIPVFDSNVPVFQQCLGLPNVPIFHYSIIPVIHGLCDEAC
jgi:hypothetical protein